MYPKQMFVLPIAAKYNCLLKNQKCCTYRWYNDYNLRDFGLNKDGLLKAYFLAMSSIYEPDRATQRLAWAQTSALIDTISVYFETVSAERKREFVQTFTSTATQSNHRYADIFG